MKNSNDTSWDRTSDFPICSTAPKFTLLDQKYKGPRDILKAGHLKTRFNIPESLRYRPQGHEHLGAFVWAVLEIRVPVNVR